MTGKGDALDRIKMAFRLNGEWILLGLFCFLCATGGYSLAAWQFRSAVQDNQVHNDQKLEAKEAEWVRERQFFRDRLDVRNKQLVAKTIAYEKLTQLLAKQGITAGEAANSSAKAAESVTKALETISTEKPSASGD